VRTTPPPSTTKVTRLAIGKIPHIQRMPKALETFLSVSEINGKFR